MSNKFKLTLEAILDAVRKIREFTTGIHDGDGLYGNKMAFDAVLMNFVVIGEMVDRLPEEFRSMHPQIEWRKIKGFRNLIAHDYFGIDAEEVWQIIAEEIPNLELRLDGLIKSLQ